MKILALDTATEACSAALYIEGEVAEQYQLAPREHTRLILGMADSLLADAGLTVAELDCLAFGRGPGSFTGVRIATGVVQGLAFAADLPVVPVSTLAAIAQLSHQQQGHQQVLAALDARMGGIYWGCYQENAEGIMQLHGTEQVSPPDQLATPGDTPWVMAGSACEPYQAALADNTSLNISVMQPELLPHAASMTYLAALAYKQGEAVEAAQAQPVYLRDDVAKKAAQQ